MNKYVVTYTLIPTNYNRPTSVVVEAENENDARAVVRDSLRDLAAMSNYVYQVGPYTPPPKGRIIGPA